MSADSGPPCLDRRRCSRASRLGQELLLLARARRAVRRRRLRSTRASSRRTNLTVHLRRQRLYRGRRDRHVDGDHLRQYRRLGRLADRRAGDDLRHARASTASRSGSPGWSRSSSAWRVNAAHRRARRLSAHPLDRRDARHALDPQGRADHRHRRRLDHQPAAGLPARAVPPARRAARRSGSWSC